MCAARVRVEASGVAVNVPLHSTPFACSARKPACAPNTRLTVSTASTASAATSGSLEDPELDPGRLQPVGQRRAHRGGGGHLTGGLRQLVVRQAERRLGQHLRRLAVAGVSAADLGDDALAASLADD